jgi:hypothetical protein
MPTRPTEATHFRERRRHIGRDRARPQLAGFEAMPAPARMPANMESGIHAKDLMINLGRRLARGADHPAPRVSRWSNLARQVRGVATRLAARIARLTDSMRGLGPYAAIALILPGGSLIALGLLGLRHRAGMTPLRGLVLAAIIGASIMLPGRA